MSGDFRRRAEFIWRPRGLGKVTFSPPTPRSLEEANRHIYFRRTFEITEIPPSVPVWATADGRYRIFVNGVALGRGPARSSAAYRFVDRYDLAPYLRPGRNAIAILAHSYGRNTAWYELPGWDHGRAFGCGGLFLQGEVATPGHNLRLDTGEEWRCLNAEAWQRDVPSNSLGWSEVFDARQLPDGWTEADFDDSVWEIAEILRVAGRHYSGDVVPFQYLLDRDIPAQREGPRALGRPISCHEVETVTQGNDVAARMLAETSRPLSACRANTALDTFDIAPGRGISVVYDFGEVVAGYIGFEVEGPAGAEVDFYPGEQLLPDGRVRIFDGIPGFDPPVAHRYVMRAGRQSWERFEWNGLRYLQLTFRDAAEPLHVRAVTVIRTGYPVEERGAFECSDPVLNRLWEVGARTLRLCMHDAYIDCPSREQRQYMDVYVQARFNYAAFGDTRLAARLLRQMSDSQRPEGLTMLAAPGDFGVACFTNIPDFCLLWIMMIGDYLMYADDPEIVDDIYHSVAKALRWFEHYLDDEDLLTEVPHWVFVDWAETDRKGQVTTLNAQFVAALRVASRLANIVGHARAATKHDAMAKRVSAAINGLLWDEDRGVYVDSRYRGRPSRRISQQSNAIVIALDIALENRWDRIWPAILDPQRLVLTHALDHEGNRTPFDEETQVVLAQAFHSHFLHAALRRSGNIDQIVNNLRTRWGEMLVDGESTFRETWQLDPVTSKCHAWSATPTFDLSTDILGVTPIAEGFRRLRIVPHIAGLQWARGRYPTPHGEVLVHWQRREDDVWLQVNLPAGCEAEVQCPITSSVTSVGAGEHVFLNGIRTAMPGGKIDDSHFSP
ncbi:MAG: family 78 glycoside hydrolase catalytic domain [Proteobacteria bacterium]|nr:family 78 glycoside hydrolase catalytic domain [Pseudomonadota bacterium]